MPSKSYLAHAGSIALGVLALAVACSGCGTVTQQHVLENLQGCERHYDGTVSGGMTGGQFSGTVKIDCPNAAASVAFKPSPVSAPPS